MEGSSESSRIFTASSRITREDDRLIACELRADEAQALVERSDVAAVEALAARYDDYSDFGSSTNPKFGLNWSPTDWFKVRGSYGTSFRARRTVLASEAVAQRDLDVSRARFWKIESAERTSALGAPTAYALMPGSNVPPMYPADALYAPRRSRSPRASSRRSPKSALRWSIP